MQEHFSDSNSQRRLKRASEHVSAFWLPLDRAVIAKATEYVSTHETFFSSEIFASIIGKDPYLYFYVIRELSKSDKNIFSATPKDITAVITATQAASIPHSLDSSLDFQRSLLEQLRISLAASLTLCNDDAIDQDLAYTATVFRQLGLNLIAWNYSKVFSESLSDVRPSVPLEQILEKKLGFSPTDLALKIVSGWSLADEVLASLHDRHTPYSLDIDLEEFNLKAQRIKHICSISEALARANNPQLYPSAERDWQFANSQIKLLLGDDGLSIIEKTFKRFVGREVNLDAQTKLQNTIRATYEPPAVVLKLNRSLRNEFYALYGLMGVASPAEVIRTAVKEIGLLGSFHGLKVYALDPLTSELRVQLSAGKTFGSTGLVITRDNEDSTILESFNHPGEIQMKSLHTGAGLQVDMPITSLSLTLISKRSVFGVLYVEGGFLINEALTGEQKFEIFALATAIEDALSFL